MLKRILAAPAAAICLLVVSGPGLAQELLFNQNVTPDVIATAPLAREGRVSTGVVAGNGGYTVDRRNGVELGLRARFNGGDASTVQDALLAGDNRYFFPAGNAPGEGGRVPTWAFDWSINVDPDSELGRNLNALSYEIFLDGDPGPGVDFLSFGPLDNPPGGVAFDIRCLIAFGNNGTGLGGGTAAGLGCSTPQIVQLRNNNNVMQSSCDYDCPRLDQGPLADFDPDVPGIYTLAIEARADGVLVARTEIDVVIGEGVLALDLTGPDSVSTAVDFYEARLRNIGARVTEDNVEALFTISRNTPGLDEDDLTLEYCLDPSATSGADCMVWESLGFDLVGDSLQGRFGPPGGFPVDETYDETTFLRASFNAAGAYTIDASILSVPGAELLALDQLIVLVDAGGGVFGDVTVQGSGGPVLPAEGAGVIARLPGGGAEIAATSSAGGEYTLLGLPLGDYDLSAVQSGFATLAATVVLNEDGVISAGPDFALQSSVEGDFALTVDGVSIEDGAFVAGATIEDVNLSFDRTDAGGPVDFNVSLSVRDSDGNELDWTNPAAGIFSSDTLMELDGLLGTDPGDDVYSIDGQSGAVILNDVTLTLGNQADQIASLDFRLIDNRYLPGRIVHAATDFNVSVESPAIADVQLSIEGPTVLPVTEQGIYAVTLINQGDAATPENVEVRFTISRLGIDTGDVVLDFCQDSASEDAPADCNWLPLTLDSDNGSLSGRFGPPAGFEVPVGYDATTFIRASFAEGGNYSVQADVLGINSASVLASDMISIAVPAVAFEIEEGVAAGVDDSEVGFGYFTAVLANMGAELPELVRLYIAVTDSEDNIVDNTNAFEYWDGTSWQPLDWIAGEERWAFGPGSGFPVGEDYLAATPVRADFPNGLYDLVITVETADRDATLIWTYGLFERTIALVSEPEGELAGQINGADADGQRLTVGDAFDLELTAADVLPRSGKDLFVVFDGQRPSDSGNIAGEVICEALLGATDCGAIAAGIGFANALDVGASTLFDGEVSIRADAETGTWTLNFYLVEALDDGAGGSTPGQVVDTLSVALTIDEAAVAIDGLGTSTLTIEFSTDVLASGGLYDGLSPAAIAAGIETDADKQAFLDEFFQISISVGGVPTPITAGLLDQQFGVDWDAVDITGTSDSLSVTFEEGVIDLDFSLDQGNTGATRIDVEWVGTDAFVTAAGGQPLVGPAAADNPFKVEFDVDYSLATGPAYDPATATFIDRTTLLQRPFATGIAFGAVTTDPVAIEFPAGTSATVSFNEGAAVPYVSGELLVDAGDYIVLVTNVSNPGILGGAQTAVTFTIEPTEATIIIGDLNQAFDGDPKPVSVTTIPDDLNVIVTYNGELAVPIDAGEYTVEVTVDEDNFVGSATATLVIEPAQADVEIDDLVQVFDGQPKPVSVTTVPAGLNVIVSYDGNAAAPTDAGEYTVVVTVDEDNYIGSASATLTIARAPQTIDFGPLPDRTTEDAPFTLSATASSGLTVEFAVLPGPATINGNVVTLTGEAGEVSIEASQPGDGNWLPAETVTQIFSVVEPAELVLSIAGPTQIEPSVEGFYAVQLENVGEGPGTENVTVEFLIERRGLSVEDISIEFCADDASEAGDCTEWVAVVPQQDGEGRLVGRFGPDAGFATPESYDETTLLRVSFDRVGPHRVTLDVFTVDSRELEATDTIQVIVGDALFRDRFEAP